MRKSLVAGCAAFGLLAAASSAVAATITYDQVLATPGGWYAGDGNPNGGFTVAVDNGVQVALRAKERQSPAVINTPTNVYNVNAGAQTAAGGNAARAWWQYEFGIDLSGAGLTLNDVYTSFTVFDLTANRSGTTDILTEWPDNDTWGASGESAGGVQDLNDWSAQNSQNPVFGQFPVNDDPNGYTFDMNAENYYRIVLSVFSDAGALLVSNSIDIAVGDAVAPAPVPEPATISLLGLGAVGLIAARIRRRRASAV